MDSGKEAALAAEELVRVIECRPKRACTKEV